MATRQKAGGKAGISIMPYSWFVGQQQLKTALELSFVAPQLNGVLLSGQRGTGKSTLVRAFCVMAYGRLPVTLPINATEDRVIGGWMIEALLSGKQKWQPGILEQANASLLYIDEVNLLDDHVVNIILDVTSTGMLNIDRDGRHEEKEVRFILTGTMNPSEGGLRPQLIDRFGLMADVVAESDPAVRKRVLEAVLAYDIAKSGGDPARLTAARKQDREKRAELEAARRRLSAIDLLGGIRDACVRIGREFGVEGHRADYTMAIAARARAAIEGRKKASVADLEYIAPLVLQHRRPGGQLGGWGEADSAKLRSALDRST